MMVSAPMREVIPIKRPKRVRYDFPTAVTFLLAGAALGGILTLLFSPTIPATETRSWLDADYDQVGPRR
jgi:hypothetical protein